MLPNVFSRYFHFIGASLTATSLFLIGFLGRDKLSSDVFSTHPEFLFDVRKKLYGTCFVVTIAQFVVGPLVLFTLPSHGITFMMLSFLSVAVLLAACLLYLLYAEMKRKTPYLDNGYRIILVVFTAVVGLMVSVRHLYREQALAAHKATQKEKTEAFLAESAAAIIDKSLAKDVPTGEVGKLAFETTCGGCHAIDKVLVGPTVGEIQKIYAGNRDGIVSWSKNPGKKRQGMAMPSMAHVPEDELKAIADWILTAK
jgi:cytochrome c